MDDFEYRIAVLFAKLSQHQRQALRTSLNVIISTYENIADLNAKNEHLERMLSPRDESEPQ